MKKFNLLIAGIAFLYFALLLIMVVFFDRQTQEKSSAYLVEVNRIMKGMEEQEGFFMPALDEEELIDAVTFLKEEEGENPVKVKDFYRKRNGYETRIEPLIVEEKLLGMVRFDYKRIVDNETLFWRMMGIMGTFGLLLLGVLFFVRQKILRPFLILQNMPYELSKGRLGTEMEESRSRFFGKFVWGINMLRDNLKASQAKNLKLEREKKMMLLSISHDIKTPLNSIKLYAKAMEEGLYDSKEKQTEAAGAIQKLSGEIEEFVKEIVKNSSEEILPIEVTMGEFYLKELATKIGEYYGPRCKLLMTDLEIGSFDDRLIKGDCDKAFEVIENLMENAFKYGDGKRISISFYEEEGCQLLRLESSGNPVKEEEMPHLFDSFYRGSNTGKQDGNGLGLYICREIMRKMEGEIFAQRSNEGMSFHIVFPMV